MQKGKHSGAMGWEDGSADCEGVGEAVGLKGIFIHRFHRFPQIMESSEWKTSVRICEICG